MLPQKEKKRQDEQTKNEAVTTAFVPTDIPGEKPENNPAKRYRSYHKASYSFEQVIADLVDNSIDAGSTFAEIYLQPQDLDEEPKEHNFLHGADNFYCIVLDDGKGIDEADMLPIMSRGFDRHYDEIELGSYGVGLKDSSLSQAYELTVMSKTPGSDKISIRRLSSCLIRRYEMDLDDERVFREEDLDPWMIETEAFTKAKALLTDLDHGTAIVLEGMHKLELKVGEGERTPYENAIRTRVKNYLRLVFQYYIEGVEVPRSDGTSEYKQIDIFYGGREEFHKLEPLDPFYREPEFMDGTREGTNCVTKEFKTAVKGDQVPRTMKVTAWLIPHSRQEYGDGRKRFPGVYDKEMKHLAKTKEGSIAEDGTVGGVGLVDLQGAYIYRNMRLISFAPDRDPWLGLMTKDSHLNQGRLEVHLPPGKLIGFIDDSDFDINTSKSTVGIATTLIEQMRDWAGKKENIGKFHPDDPKELTLRERIHRRNGRDQWKKCSICGSEHHTKRSCPEAPKKSVNLESKTNASLREYSKEATTNKKGVEKSSNEPRPKSVRVRPLIDGDLVSTAREGDDIVVRVNISDPLLGELKDGISRLGVKDD